MYLTQDYGYVLHAFRKNAWSSAIWVAGLLISGCERGEALENQAPDTHLAVKSIERSGADRLNSKVQMSWYGTDIDGYITGYALSLDSLNWKLTTSQDSTFLFSIPAGSDTADITLYIRAIDNHDCQWRGYTG
jgi:hypothetical protein